MIALLRGIGVLAFLGAHTATWNDLPLPVQAEFSRSGIDGSAFPSYIERLRRKTAERVREGEADHLIFFALQSKSFTERPPIEPALSARRLVEGLPAAERACYLNASRCEVSIERIPADAARRLDDFSKAMKKRVSGERMTYFLQTLDSGMDLSREYLRAMRFLYLKEFVLRAKPDEARALYARRGHSTDTSLAAGFAVRNALEVLSRSAQPPRFRRALLIGPGLDIAPRTGFDDAVPPQSYQPFALLDALGPDATIHCVDVNPRVVRYLEKLPPRPRLFLAPQTGDEEFLSYARNVGSAIGKRTADSLEVENDAARRIEAELLDIVTERPAGQFDLAVATNVLLYFDGKELMLALLDIALSLKTGGYLIHNDLRPELDGMTRMAGLESVAARTLRIGPGLFDSFAIYRKR